MPESQLDSDVQALADSLGQLPGPVVRPAFVVVSGLPGTGKSHFCNRLAERLPFLVLETDSLRKALFRSPTYSPGESERLFRAVHVLTERLLRAGVPTILDATSLLERHREPLYGIAERSGAKLIVVRVEAPPEVVRERLAARQTAPGGKSDADWEVYRRLEPSVERIRRRHFVVDTSKDISPVLDKIIREVRR